MRSEHHPTLIYNPYAPHPYQHSRGYRCYKTEPRTSAENVSNPIKYYKLVVKGPKYQTGFRAPQFKTPKHVVEIYISNVGLRSVFIVY